MTSNRFRQLWAHAQWAIEVYRLRRVACYLGVLLVLWFAAGTALWVSERQAGSGPGNRFHHFTDCLWYSTVYLLSGLEEYEPNTAFGKGSALMVMIAGVAMLGLLGTTVLAAVVESVGLTSRVKFKPSSYRLKDHVVICGWSPKGDAIVKELHAKQFDDGLRRPVIIVAPEACDIRVTDGRAYAGVWAVTGDPAHAEVLERADVAAAHSVIVLSPTEERGGPGPDARTVLVSLALHAVCPQVHTCAEVVDRKSLEHLERISVDEQVCVRGVAARLIGHAASKHHLTEFFFHLLTVSASTNEVYAVDVPESLIGLTFREVQRQFAHGPLSQVIPVGIQRTTARTCRGEPVLDRSGRPVVRRLLTINPRLDRPEDRYAAGEQEDGCPRYFDPDLVDDQRVPRETRLEKGDRLVFIANTEPRL